MKKVNWIFTFLILVSSLIVSCEPSRVIVRERPVEPVYVRSVSPGPSYVWVNGAWIGSGRNYNYRQGYWTLPPRPHAVYHDGYWSQRKGGYSYHRGGWYR